LLLLALPALAFSSQTAITLLPSGDSGGVSLQLPSIKLPTIPSTPAIDPNPAVKSVGNIVSSLPVQTPVSVSTLPTVPSVDPNSLVNNTVAAADTTVNQVNGVLPVQLPAPSDLISVGGANSAGPPQAGASLPGSAGGVPGGSAAGSGEQARLTVGPGTSASPDAQIEFIPAQLAGQTNSPSLATRQPGGLLIASLGNYVNLYPLQVPPSSGSGWSLPGLTEPVLSLLPFIGIILALIAIVAFFRSAKCLWHPQA
jgi:hypothetical protein